MRREVDSVVRDPALGKVVGPDLFRALARPHLSAALPGDRFLLLPQLDLVQAGTQHLHRLLTILDLRLFILLRHDQARWQVREPYRRVGRVHALPAWTARAKGID